MYALAGIEVVVLVATALTRGQSDHLIRATIATAVIGGGWFVLAFVAGGGIGLGDVRLAALTGALLGWLGWPQALHAQLVMVAFAGVTAVVAALMHPAERSRKMRVPLGPALVASTLIVAWT